MPVVAIQRGGQRVCNWDNYAERFRIAASMYRLDKEWVDACLVYALYLHKHKLPIIYDQEHLGYLTGIDVNVLLNAANNTVDYYKIWKIPKKRQGEFREIAEPLPSLKLVQRFLYSKLFAFLPISKYAKGFVPQKNVLDHVRWHTGQRVVCLLDLKDYFPSISGNRVYGLLRSYGYTKEISWLIAKLCTLNGGLPQGAPTSPVISNVITRRMDNRLFGLARKFGMRYSRYADDIAFSGNDFPRRVIRYAQEIIEDEGFALNESKSRILQSSQRQEIVGVVVNEKRQLRRSMRRSIRQQMYFIEKYGLLDHMRRSGTTRSAYLSHLLGRVEWARYINPGDEEMRTYSLKLRKFMSDYIT